MQLLCRLVIISLMSSCVIFVTTAQSKPHSANVADDENIIKNDLKNTSHEITKRIYTKDIHGKNTKIIEIDYDFFGEIIDKRVYLTSGKEAGDKNGGVYNPITDPGMGEEMSSQAVDPPDLPQTLNYTGREGAAEKKQEDSAAVVGRAETIVQPGSYAGRAISGVPVIKDENPAHVQVYLRNEDGDLSIDRTHLKSTDKADNNTN